MYPYLRYIAHSNALADPFDDRVVEAYWIGNAFLKQIRPADFYRHLLDEQKLKGKIGARAFAQITEKISRGALPHHSFHVFNVWKRTGHVSAAHTLESMDACRISWGTVRAIDGPILAAETEPLTIHGEKLALGNPAIKKIARALDIDFDIHIGDVISIHWDVPCEILNLSQVSALRSYTRLSISFANQSV